MYVFSTQKCCNHFHFSETAWNVATSRCHYISVSWNSGICARPMLDFLISSRLPRSTVAGVIWPDKFFTSTETKVTSRRSFRQLLLEKLCCIYVYIYTHFLNLFNIFTEKHFWKGNVESFWLENKFYFKMACNLYLLSFLGLIYIICCKYSKKYQPLWQVFMEYSLVLEVFGARFFPIPGKPNKFFDICAMFSCTQYLRGCIIIIEAKSYIHIP